MATSSNATRSSFNEGQIQELHKNSIHLQHFWLLSSAMILLNMTARKTCGWVAAIWFPTQGFLFTTPEPKLVVVQPVPRQLYTNQATLNSCLKKEAR